ncbi:hypothetical protein FRC03_005929 [Tulasnella sp. 419]|nr:hypothetical protein FRC03_005929 [Tulasnella sp. 419]
MSQLASAQNHKRKKDEPLSVIAPLASRGRGSDGLATKPRGRGLGKQPQSLSTPSLRGRGRGTLTQASANASTIMGRRGGRGGAPGRSASVRPNDTQLLPHEGSPNRSTVIDSRALQSSAEKPVKKKPNLGSSFKNPFIDNRNNTVNSTTTQPIFALPAPPRTVQESPYSDDELDDLPSINEVVRNPAMTPTPSSTTLRTIPELTEGFHIDPALIDEEIHIQPAVGCAAPPDSQTRPEAKSSERNNNYRLNLTQTQRPSAFAKTNQKQKSDLPALPTPQSAPRALIQPQGLSKAAVDAHFAPNDRMGGLERSVSKLAGQVKSMSELTNKVEKLEELMTAKDDELQDLKNRMTALEARLAELTVTGAVVDDGCQADDEATVEQSNHDKQVERDLTVIGKELLLRMMGLASSKDQMPDPLSPNDHEDLPFWEKDENGEKMKLVPRFDVPFGKNFVWSKDYMERWKNEADGLAKQYRIGITENLLSNLNDDDIENYRKKAFISFKGIHNRNRGKVQLAAKQGVAIEELEGKAATRRAARHASLAIDRKWATQAKILILGAGICERLFHPGAQSDEETANELELADIALNVPDEKVWMVIKHSWASTKVRLIYLRVKSALC